MEKQQENTNIVDLFGEAALELREYSERHFRDTPIQIPVIGNFDVSIPLEEKLLGMFKRTGDYKGGRMCRIGKKIDKTTANALSASGFISGLSRSQFNDLFLEPEMFNRILKEVYESIPSFPLAKRTELENSLKQIIKVVKAAKNDELKLIVKGVTDVNNRNLANNPYLFDDHYPIHLTDNLGNDSFKFLYTYDNIKRFDFKMQSSYDPDIDRYKYRKIEDGRVIENTNLTYEGFIAHLSNAPLFVDCTGVYLYVQNKSHAERAIADFKNSLLKEYIPSCKDAPIICRIEELLSEGFKSFMQKLREDNRKVIDLQGKEF